MSSQHRRPSTSQIESPPDQSTSGTNDSSGNGQAENKRRRVPSSVTPNACTNCKKAKTKVATPSVALHYGVLTMLDDSVMGASQHAVDVSVGTRREVATMKLM